MLYSVVECNSGILVAVQYVNRCWGGGGVGGCWLLCLPLPLRETHSYYVLYTFTCSEEWLLGGGGLLGYKVIYYIPVGVGGGGTGI